MFSQAAEFENKNFEAARAHVQALAKRLGSRPLDIITHNLTKPLIMTAGRHRFLVEMTMVDDNGDFQRRTSTIGFVPFAILFGSANFDNEAAVKGIASTDGINTVRSALQRIRRVSNHYEANRLLGCIFTAADVTPINENEDAQTTNLTAKQLPTPEQAESALAFTKPQDLSTPTGRAEYVRLRRLDSLQFYGYASLASSTGLHTLTFHSWNDESHGYLPAVGQESVMDIYRPLSDFNLRRPQNVSGYSLRDFPLQSHIYANSEPGQLTGGTMYYNQLVYLTDVSDLDFKSLTTVISATVSP